MRKRTVVVIGLFTVYLLGYPAIYFGQRWVLFHDVPLADSVHFSFRQPFQEISLRPEKGVLLNTLIFKTDSVPRRGVVLYFHGNADNLVRWGQYADRFLRNGYDVWMYDYRQFGKSKGPLTEDGLYRDAEFMYQQVVRAYPEHRVVLYGYSLGTGLATYVAARHRPRLLLLEAPYYSIADLANRRAPVYPYQSLLRFRFPTYQRIGRVRCPIHLFHGTADETVSYASGQRLAAVLPQKQAAVLTTIVGGKHKNLAQYGQYNAALDSLLAR
ncbi:alpha/beta hydrolase [Spirosoma arcticum]